MKQNGALHNLATEDIKIGTGDKSFNMENQASDNIETLFAKAGDYVETRIDLFKLKAIDRSSDVISSLVSKLAVLIAFTIFFIILNIGLALLLGELLGKSYYGFFVLAGLYLITGLIFNSQQKKWFKEPIVDKLIKKFLN